MNRVLNKIIGIILILILLNFLSKENIYEQFTPINKFSKLELETLKNESKNLEYDIEKIMEEKVLAQISLKEI